MSEIYNFAIEQRFLLIAMLMAVPLFAGWIKDRQSLRIFGFVFFYLLFHYLWGRTWFIHYAPIGWIAMAVGVVVVGLVVPRFIALYRDSVDHYSHNSFISSIQFALVLASGILAAHAVSTVLVTKGVVQTEERLLLKSPLVPGTYGVINGGFLSSNNDDYNVPAKEYALHLVSLKGQDGVEVIAPCEGDVKAILRPSPKDRSLSELWSLPERLRSGTSVVLRCYGTTKMLVLANLRTHSIAVDIGQSLALGQPIAVTGRTEYRSRPGLILFAVETPSTDTEVLFRSGKGAVIRINDKLLVRSESISL